MIKTKHIVLGVTAFLFFASAGVAFALNTTVPSAPSAGYGLVSNSAGTPGNFGYVATTTSPWHVGYIFSTSTATSTYGGGINLTSGCIAINGVCVSGGGGGSVTAVTGTYPIISSGGNTPAISTAFGTTTNWGIGTNGFVVTGATGIPFRAASSTLNLPSTALANTAVTAGTYTCTNLTVNAEGQITAASNGSCTGGTGTFPFTVGSYGGLTANSTSTPIRFLGTGAGTFSTIASSTFASLASTTNFENTLYADSWPGANIGQKIQNAYDASLYSPHIHVSGNGTSTFPTTINFGTKGKRVLLTCDPGVTLQYTGTVAAINLNATDLNDLSKGWGEDGCKIVGNGSYQGVGIAMGGSNGAQGAFVKNSTIMGFNQAITIGANTWVYDVDYNFIQDNNQAVSVASANNSGEGANFDHDTFADCKINIDKCVFFDTSASDGAYFGHPVFDDAGIYFSDGVLGWTIDTGKWENPGAPIFPSYTYLTCEDGGFNNGTLVGGTMMNGAPNQASSPKQFGLIGCKLSVAGSLTLNNETGDDSTMASAFNVYGSGYINVQNYDDISAGNPTVTTLSTTTPLFAVDNQSGLLETTLPLQIHPGGSISPTGYLFMGEDAGGGFTDIGAYDTNSGFMGLYLDASPLAINTRGGGDVGIGTANPSAILSVLRGGDFTPLAPGNIFDISSSTQGRATSTPFAVTSAGYTNIGGQAVPNINISNIAATLTTPLAQLTGGDVYFGDTNPSFKIRNTVWMGTLNTPAGFISTGGLQFNICNGGGYVASSTSCITFGNPAANNTSIAFGSTSPNGQQSKYSFTKGTFDTQRNIFTVASSTNFATTTLFNITSQGLVDIFAPTNPSSAKILNVHSTADNAIVAVGRDDGSLFQIKAQDIGQTRLTYSRSDGSTGSALQIDSDQAGTPTMTLTSDNKVGIGATSSPIATLGVQGTVAAKLTTFSTGDFAVCQRGAGGVLTFDSGQATCAVSSMFLKDEEGEVAYADAKARIDKVRVIEFKYKDSGKQDIGAFAEEMAKVDQRYATYTQVKETIDGHTFEPGDAKGINWTAVEADMIVMLQHQDTTASSTTTIVEKAVRGAEENWQDAFIALLIIAVTYLFNEVRKLKAKK